jgi:hypothetical protein
LAKGLPDCLRQVQGKPESSFKFVTKAPSEPDFGLAGQWVFSNFLYSGEG